MSAAFFPFSEPFRSDSSPLAFTRWCNTYLVERMLKVDNLATDLHDGVNLVNLLEIISSKQIKYNKQPKLLMQKLGKSCDLVLISILLNSSPSL